MERQRGVHTYTTSACIECAIEICRPDKADACMQTAWAWLNNNHRGSEDIPPAVSRPETPCPGAVRAWQINIAITGKPSSTGCHGAAQRRCLSRARRAVLDGGVWVMACVISAVALRHWVSAPQTQRRLQPMRLGERRRVKRAEGALVDRACLTHKFPWTARANDQPTVILHTLSPHLTSLSASCHKSGLFSAI